MPVKLFEIEGMGPLKVVKSRTNRHIKLSLDHAGRPRVSIPTWLPYRTGLEFALTKRDWLTKVMQDYQPEFLTQGMGIGKAHRLVFVTTDGGQARSSLRPGEVRVLMPAGAQIEDPNVQKVAERACQRALKAEAERLIPQRVAQLASATGTTYTSISVKQLRGRWGSCSQQKELTFNSYLMQLPWELIDYVITHELVHTLIMAHGPEFWLEMGKHVNDLPAKRKQIRAHRPRLMGTRLT